MPTMRLNGDDMSSIGTRSRAGVRVSVAFLVATFDFGIPDIVRN
jgi:hypothetical protein